jgi:hypothetical protein
MVIPIGHIPHKRCRAAKTLMKKRNEQCNEYFATRIISTCQSNHSAKCIAVVVVVLSINQSKEVIPRLSHRNRHISTAAKRTFIAKQRRRRFERYWIKVTRKAQRKDQKIQPPPPPTKDTTSFILTKLLTLFDFPFSPRQVYYRVLNHGRYCGLFSFFDDDGGFGANGICRSRKMVKQDCLSLFCRWSRCW